MTADGFAKPDLIGNWFENGFEGTMGEVLCAIEEGRADAEDNPIATCADIPDAVASAPIPPSSDAVPAAKRRPACFA